jgi:hypothetical protein
VLVELDVVDAVEFGDGMEVEAVEVAAMTQGDASSAAAMVIPATTTSFAVLVFIFRRDEKAREWYILDFRDVSKISRDSTQEVPSIEGAPWNDGLTYCMANVGFCQFNGVSNLDRASSRGRGNAGPHVHRPSPEQP